MQKRANSASNIRTHPHHLMSINININTYPHAPSRSGAKVERSSRSSAGPVSDRGMTACPRRVRAVLGSSRAHPHPRTQASRRPICLGRRTGATAALQVD
jgi:hypothetical protein